ncbi:MAG: type II toxin-antitoxin system RelE/ParE family toxin [Methanomicrobiaceae archaeon]|uniref:type II toxin-antitoxin system RelE family toxin n=1 Tax=Methanoculleus sp. TaxID=90427 RepID=UPI003210061D|nr:type II toxin-antitoxin system RelE/ParE family toxin [Methanomicrobiaceae archaeon]
MLRDLAHLPVSVGTRILDEVEGRAQEPDPIRHVKRLKGRSQNPSYSLRVGRYRAISNIYGDGLLIVVVEVGHRSKFYQKH